MGWLGVPEEAQPVGKQHGVPDEVVDDQVVGVVEDEHHGEHDHRGGDATGRGLFAGPKAPGRRDSQAQGEFPAQGDGGNPSFRDANVFGAALECMQPLRVELGHAIICHFDPGKGLSLAGMELLAGGVSSVRKPRDAGGGQNQQQQAGLPQGPAQTRPNGVGNDPCSATWRMRVLNP